MTNQKKFASNGVGYYNIDNCDNVENRENIANIFSRETEANASQSILSSQEVAKPKNISVIQAPTPPSLENVERMLSQIFYNTNSTQKHKLKVKLQHNDQKPTEWIATMNTDPRVFRKYNDLDLAREWIAGVRKHFSEQMGFKKPYLGKFHLVRDAHGLTNGTQKEPGCFAAMSYNKNDQSWYAMIAIYDFVVKLEYDYNFSNRQQTQGVKAQIVWNNPQLQVSRRPGTYAQRNGLG